MNPLNRRNFLMNSAQALTAAALAGCKDVNQVAQVLPEDGRVMPVVFVGHGSPMLAIEQSPYSQAWETLGHSLPTPKMVLCISAHWQTPSLQITAMAQPRTIHDFGGFPHQLQEKLYPAPGWPAAAEEIRAGLSSASADLSWGLDHGCWCVLSRMYPEAKIPVMQLSLVDGKNARWHFELGRQLMSLRRRCVLIIGSGNIVHNLRTLKQGPAYDWAEEFDTQVKSSLVNRDDEALIEYQRFGKAASLSVPTDEHYLPMMPILGLRRDVDKLGFLNEGLSAGSISMRSFTLG